MSRVGSLLLLSKQWSRSRSLLHRFVNLHIRADKHNQLHLRTEMTEQDKETIRAAGRNEDALSARILKDKMRREHLYANFV
jgi:hypothetical protein